MTFGSFGGFLVDIAGPAGDLMYGQNDNFYDPCSPRVTVGVGERVPVVIRASGVVIVGLGQPIENAQTLQNNAVQVTAQSISVRVSQPGGASNPIRQEQQQNLTQPQTIAISPANNDVIGEFVENGQSVGSILLTPKIVDIASGSKTLLTDGANVVRQLSQQIAVEVEATRQTAQILSQADDVLFNQLAQQLRNNQGNLQQILQKAGVGFDDINSIRNAMLQSNNKQLTTVLQRVSNSVPAITKNLQTAAANVAVRACG